MATTSTSGDRTREATVRYAVLFEQGRVAFGYRPSLDVPRLAARVLDTISLFADPALPGRLWPGLHNGAEWPDDAFAGLADLLARSWTA